MRMLTKSWSIKCKRELAMTWKLRLYGSFPKQEDPNKDPQFDAPFHGDPRKGTPDFGKPPYSCLQGLRLGTKTFT